MSAILLDGKAVSKKVKLQVAWEAAELKRLTGTAPGLAVVIVGGDPASRLYVNNKKKDCLEVGITSREYALPETVSQGELLALITELNADKEIDGILVQLPLPKSIDEKAVIAAIDPSKDVDAFHPVSVGKIMRGDFDFLPCTPAGVMEMIDDAGIEIKGMECVVIGRSNIVGKPMAMLLLHRHGTVTICHTRTRDLPGVARRADILVVAAGRPRFVTADFVKEGAVVIDVGMNRQEDGKFCGDVDFDAVKEKASYITPVPGGVGPMTRAILLRNTIRAAKLHQGLEHH